MPLAIKVFLMTPIILSYISQFSSIDVQFLACFQDYYILLISDILQSYSLLSFCKCFFSILIQITLASFFNKFTSSSTDPTVIPPFLSAGISTFSTFNLGWKSIPNSSNLNVSIGFFLALRIDCTFAKRGLFKRKSQVNTAGKDTCIFYNPKSTSLVTNAFLPLSSNSIFDEKVAEGMPMIAPRICPVWL